MLVRFSSVATESITMFGDVAVRLIKMMGATGAVPSALSAADIPAAVSRLRQQIDAAAVAEQTAAERRTEEDDEDREPAIALATRAAPLIDLLERAAAADAPLMWERA